MLFPVLLTVIIVLGFIVMVSGSAEDAMNYYLYLSIANDKIKKGNERIRTCIMLNNMFPIEPNTCSVPPTSDFRDIYTTDQSMELWKFQQKHCVPKDIKPQVIIIGIIAFTIPMLMLSCM